jgi:hypothetical protein
MQFCVNGWEGLLWKQTFGQDWNKAKRRCCDRACRPLMGGSGSPFDATVNNLQSKLSSIEQKRCSSCQMRAATSALS